ncbi:unnamed protein product, partial [Caenorhabditis auriculariae]
MLRELFLLCTLAFLAAASDSCEDCLASGKQLFFCTAVNKCDFSPCISTITRAINCPKLPDPTFGYDDMVARTKWLPLIAAGESNGHPEKCLASQWPTMTLYNTVTVNCSTYGK